MRVALTFVVLVALATGAATAQESVRPTFSKDRRGDARGSLDIVRVAMARTSRGDLRGEVTMAEPWETQALREGAAPATICLRLHTRRSPDAEPPDHLVCAMAPAEGDELIGTILRDRANGLPRQSSTAVVSRPTRRTLFFRFSPTGIGRPARVSFSAEAVTRGARCPAPLGCRDLAPDAPGAMQLRLRSTTDRR